MLKLDKNNYDNTFFLYIIWCSICENSETMQYNDSSVKYGCNIIDVKNKQLLHCYTPKSVMITTLIHFITRVLLFETE